MNKHQAVMLIVAAINLLLMLLFPPYDYHGYTQYSAPTFGGFLFAFADHPNRVLNDNFLSIEIFVVLINTAIAWLLLHPRARLRRQLDRQNLVLMGVALNLLLALLFPPFQDHYAVSTAVLPTFDGFYFVFGDNSMRVVVTAMLWIEVIFILINGAILWLLLRRSSPQEMTAAERFAQSAELLQANRRGKT